MRLLRTDCEELKLETFNDETKLPKYGILSHVWLAAEEEITFDDIGERASLKRKGGWAKLTFARDQAFHDGYQYVWVDTCCIDKKSSAELAEAINSMYRWYSLAEVCYVYLADMPTPDLSRIGDGEESTIWNWDAFDNSRWFRRGWTLQEMMAPTVLQFYNSSWQRIGTLLELAPKITTITSVHVEALRRQSPILSYSIAQRMSWAADRQTTKVEDRAYSLLGIFNINLPIIYGEGERAFTRLQEELLRVTSASDQTIFSWLAFTQTRTDEPAVDERDRQTDDLDVLATSPSAFRRCGRCVPTDNEGGDSKGTCEVVNQGIRFTLPGRKGRDGDRARLEVALNCCYQDDCTVLFVLVLAKVQNSDNAYMIHRSKGFAADIGRWASQSHVSQTLAFDSWGALIPVSQEWPADFNLTRDYSEQMSITVLRPSLGYANRQKPQTGRDTIIFDIDWRAEITLVEHAALWNSFTKSLLLPASGPLSHEEQAIRRQLDFKFGSQKLSSATLEIFATRGINERDWTGHLALQQNAGTRLVILPYTSNSPMAIDFHGMQILRTTMQYRRIVHQRLIVVRITTTPFFHGIFPAGLISLCLSSLSFLAWTLLSILMLPLTFALPVIALSVARQQAYAASGESAALFLTWPERLTIGIGSSISCAISTYVLLDSKIFFTWRPQSWRPFGAALSFVVSLFMTMMLLAKYGTASVRQKRVMLKFIAVAMSRMSSLPVGLSVCHFIHSTWLKSWTLTPLIVVDIATLVPLVILVWRDRLLIVPWTTVACQTHNIPGPASEWIEKSGVPFEDACYELARMANSVWPLVAFGFWTLLLECLGAYLTYSEKPRSMQERELRQNKLQRLVKLLKTSPKDNSSERSD